MRFLSRGWVNGDLTEDETEAALTAYWRRVGEIEHCLPEPMIRLARQVNLHDGLIDSVRWNPSAQRLELELVAYAEAGYQSVTLTYHGAMLGDDRIRAIREASRDRATVILYDEVDLDERDGIVLVHRILFRPRDEVTIDFTDLTLTVQPRDDNRVAAGYDPFYEEEDEEDDEDEDDGHAPK